MRVISGTARGHKLKSLKGMATRPTADRIKESLFNIITRYVYGAYVLDLFAGTGNLGIEALSRGAEFAVFVDRSPAAVKVIDENLIHTRLDGKAEVVTADCLDFIRHYASGNRKYDIIFMDPPYSKNHIVPVLQQIGVKNMLTKEGIIIVESEKGDLLPERLDGLEMLRSKEYGRTVMTIYQNSKDE